MSRTARLVDQPHEVPASSCIDGYRVERAEEGKKEQEDARAEGHSAANSYVEERNSFSRGEQQA
jgi:hypothetical protein